MHRDPTRRAQAKQDGYTVPSEPPPERNIDWGFWETDHIFRSFMENSHSGILIVDTNYCIQYANSVALAITGYSTRELVGHDFRQFIDEANRGLVSFRYSERQKGEAVPTRYEFQVITKTAGKRSVEIHATVIESTDGNVFTIAQLLDISDRKRAEDQLVESERKYRDIFENVQDLIFIHDLNGTVIESNMQHIDKGGYTADEVINTNIRDFMPARFKGEFDDYLERIQKNGHDQGLVVMTTRNKGELVVEYSSSLVSGPNGPYAVRGIARDITEEITTKKALKESEEKYRRIIENMQDCYTETDLSGNLTFFNDRCCDQIGYTREEMQDANNQQFMDAENINILYCTCKDVFRTGKPKQVIYALTAKNGLVNHMETLVSLINDALGQPVGFRGISRNINNRIQAEEDLRRAHNELEKRVHTRTMELGKTNRELEAKTISLEEVNTALRILLKRRDEDKSDLEKKMLHNVRELVIPYIEKLDANKLNDKQHAYLDIIKSNLNDIASPFVHDLSSRYLNLTPTEIQVANFIKHGKTTKEVASLLNLSTKTIESHRKNIRKKIGIQNKKANLRTHLLSIG